MIPQNHPLDSLKTRIFFPISISGFPELRGLNFTAADFTIAGTPRFRVLMKECIQNDLLPFCYPTPNYGAGRGGRVRYEEVR
jgi:hypothetical protein